MMDFKKYCTRQDIKVNLLCWEWNNLPHTGIGNSLSRMKGDLSAESVGSLAAIIYVCLLPITEPRMLLALAVTSGMLEVFLLVSKNAQRREPHSQIRLDTKTTQKRHKGWGRGVTQSSWSNCGQWPTLLFSMQIDLVSGFLYHLTAKVVSLISISGSWWLVAAN